MGRDLLILAPLLLGVAVGCKPADPQAKLLQERARWKVELKSWAEAEGGAINLSLRVSGPVHSTLRQLTVRVEMYDEAQNLIDHEWQTLDVSGVQRGGPEDMLVRLRARPGGIESIASMGIRTVVKPTPEEAVHIKELQG